MPEISRFLGIVIQLYYSDHARPNFHARYGGYRMTVEIESGVIKGEFPPRELRAVLDWSAAHINELRENWNRARHGRPLVDIPPLE
jgi:hypothetical protein